MNQREKISNNFSDAYLLAMLEGRDVQDVITRFSKEFPELASQFEANVDSLNLMYGNIRTEAKPSEKEIANAYAKLSEQFLPAKPVAGLITKPALSYRLKNIFPMSPTWAGATLGIGMAVIIALLWQPWIIKESLQETAKNNQEKIQTTPPEKQEFASNENQNSGDLTKMPEVQYRGKTTIQLLSTAQKKREDSIDAVRLKILSAPKSLLSAKNVIIDSLTHGSIMIRWSPVDGALSYIVEIKKANEADFHPVTQIAQTAMKLTQLESGKTYLVRIIAASGERKGLPSDAKSIVVP
jgi:hypothetical protein